MKKNRSALLVAAAVVASGCATSASADVTAPIAREAISDSTIAPTTTTTTTSTSTTTTTTTSTIAVNASCSTNHFEPVEQEPQAQELAARIETALAHPGFAGHDVSVSVWVDGWGEVATHRPDLRLLPASNQKILVAIGANETLDLESSLTTEIEYTGTDLIIRAGADPTLTFPKLMGAIDGALGDVGDRIDRLVIDTSQFPQSPIAKGWLDWHVPQFAGPLSGLMFENNRWTQDEQLVASPDRVNGERIVSFLAERDIEVGEVVVASKSDAPPPGEAIATVASVPIDSLVRTMLLHSDNQHADLLMMELGRQATGTGTLDDGAQSVNDVLFETCGSLDGLIGDGSGLSRANLRSARSFVETLAALHNTPKGDLLRSQLPVGGVSGTLAGRFGGENAGRVQAKTGTILNGRALTGWASMVNGRDAIFSVIVNGEDGETGPALGAIDALVREILAT